MQTSIAKFLCVGEINYMPLCEAMRGVAHEFGYFRLRSSPPKCVATCKVVARSCRHSHTHFIRRRSSLHISGCCSPLATRGFRSAARRHCPRGLPDGEIHLSLDVVCTARSSWKRPRRACRVSRRCRRYRDLASGGRTAIQAGAHTRALAWSVFASKHGERGWR